MAEKTFDDLVRDHITGRSMFEPAAESVQIVLSREQWKHIIDAIAGHMMRMPLNDITTEHPIVNAAAEISSTLRYGAPF